jgi:hypothetical protein
MDCICKWMIMMIMLTGQDCVSELRPLFIPKVICENGEAKWNDIDRKNSWFVHQSALWQSYQQSNLVENQEELGKGDDEYSLRRIFVHTSKWFLWRKVLRHGADGFTSLRRKACCGVSSPLKIHRLDRDWTRETSVQWQALHHLGDLFKRIAIKLIYLLM